MLDNDQDPNGDALTAVKDSDPAHGTLALAADGSFVYTPATGYTGPDQFTYHANDGTADSNTATVRFTVAQDPPVAVDDDYATRRDTPLTIAAPDIVGA